ncbi:DNA-binding GntR family transcriptional regulator [Priestia megaterium]|jgi:DNA-binding GntR family transcriptional regulator|uniref:GntR family transcriptional regulator n=1 Tax=Priestia megaterium TaxID=1404 RepID=UPI000471215A|nr:GntR family transcriptional regulator [Priestia megaterium]TCN09859.1 DNA-binding GntR family transcriptional regulator [Bacillus sp. BK006]MCM3018198.1 GntR family transcriptional regulator [Priestia megaterium]MCM3184988.1 GntR family transcriptional regulator [Priestia megaterium]MCM3195090.1 GntR family transcriptional regulator [Priestia megaterium]MED3915882.1 GntR family transcriptional regulator [Priestia megaterium]
MNKGPMIYHSLKDHVYNYIASQIQDGTLLPNDKINEASICSQLNVSRTPVREALIKLASDNLLEYRPRRGFTVKEIDTPKKLEVFEIVGALDGLAAALSIDHLTEDDFTKMNEFIKKIDVSIESENYQDYQKYQTYFHRVYLNRCGNVTLKEQLMSLQDGFIRQTYFSDDNKELYAILHVMNEHHRHILKLLKQKKKADVQLYLQNVHWKIEYPEMI